MRAAILRDVMTDERGKMMTMIIVRRRMVRVMTEVYSVSARKRLDQTGWAEHHWPVKYQIGPPPTIIQIILRSFHPRVRGWGKDS